MRRQVMQVQRGDRLNRLRGRLPRGDRPLLGVQEAGHGGGDHNERHVGQRSAT